MVGGWQDLRTMKSNESIRFLISATYNGIWAPTQTAWIQQFRWHCAARFVRL